MDGERCTGSEENFPGVRPNGEHDRRQGRLARDLSEKNQSEYGERYLPVHGRYRRGEGGAEDLCQRAIENPDGGPTIQSSGGVYAPDPLTAPILAEAPADILFPRQQRLISPAMTCH